MINLGEKADFWSDHGVLFGKEKFKSEYTACNTLALVTETDFNI